MNGFLVYFFTVSENLQTLLLALGGVSLGSGVLALFITIIWWSGEVACPRPSFDLQTNFLKKLVKSLCCVGVFSLLMGVAIPSVKEYFLYYMVSKIIKNEDVKKIPENALHLANEWLQKEISNLEKERKGK